MHTVIETTIRLRLSPNDAHDGAEILPLFGDAADELLLYAGNFLEMADRLEHVGNTSKNISMAAYNRIEAGMKPAHPYVARVLEQPFLVARATGTCVVPKGTTAVFLCWEGDE